MNGTQIVEWSQPFVVQGATLEAVEGASAEVMRTVGAHEGAVNEETYNILNAFLAALPGGTPFNLRKLLVTNKNHVDLGLWWTPCGGEPRNTFLRAPALLALESEEQSLYFFNLHLKEVGHALVIGERLDRASLSTAELLPGDTHRKYQPYTFILDVGRQLPSGLRGRSVVLTFRLVPEICRSLSTRSPWSRHRPTGQFQFDLHEALPDRIRRALHG